jgi:hypothetical protein
VEGGADDHRQRSSIQADRIDAVSVRVGVELAPSRGMSGNPNAGRLAAHQRHHSAFVAAMRWVAAVGALVLYLEGVRLLLYQGARWVISCEQIIRRVLGCP